MRRNDQTPKIELEQEAWRKRKVLRSSNITDIDESRQKNCENYRRIALVDAVNKIIAVLIKERLQQQMAKHNRRLSGGI